MLSNETNSNLNSAETKQDDLDLNKMMQDPSNAELIDNPQAQQNKLPGLLKRSIKDFSTWPTGKQALAVGAACGLISAILPLVAVGLGLAISAIPGAIVGLTVFFAVKAVQSGYKGLKWSAEKTVEGAKHLGGKIKDGYEYSADSLKRGASFVSEKTKEKTSNVLTATANKLYRAAGNENYSDRIDDELTPDSSHKRRVQGVKKDLKEIFADKGNNSGLIESIRSGISEKIEEKIKAKEEVEFTPSADDFTENLGLITRWKEQKKFIDNLDADGLRKLVTERLVDKSKYFKDSIFSEHHDEIKEVIQECKENHLYSSVSNMFDKAEKKANKPSVKGLIRSISSPSPLPLSLRTIPSLGGKKAPEEARKGTNVEYHVLSESDGISTASQSSFSEDVFNDPTVKQNLDALSSRILTRSDSVSSLASNSGHSSAISTLSGIDDSIASKSNSFSYHGDSDSGFNSPSSSTPQRHSPSQETRFDLGVTEELTEKLAKRRAIVDQPNVESVQQKAEPSKG